MQGKLPICISLGGGDCLRHRDRFVVRSLITVAGEPRENGGRLLFFGTASLPYHIFTKLAPISKRLPASDSLCEVMNAYCTQA